MSFDDWKDLGKAAIDAGYPEPVAGCGFIYMMLSAVETASRLPESDPMLRLVHAIAVLLGLVSGALITSFTMKVLLR